MAMTLDYSGKVALITGAASGIGLATARAFAEVGADLVLADRSDAVNDVAHEIRACGSGATAALGDVADPAAGKRFVDAALDAWGRLDIAFNNAGVGGVDATVDEVELRVWQRIIDVNLHGVFYGIRHQVPAMIASGGGVIVNNSSMCGMQPLAGIGPAYTTAKHGVIGLTRQVAFDHAAQGIRCLAIRPGMIETPLTKGGEGEFLDAEATHRFTQRIPQGRLGSPEDVARVVRLLCSGDAGYVNGSVVEIDGAMHLG